MQTCHKDILFLICFLQFVVTLAGELCITAQSKCVSRMGCSMALHNYYINCGPLIHGDTEECTPQCRKALISLLSTQDEVGEMFMTCDCDGNDVCLESKQRTEVCSKDVIQAVHSIDDDETMLSCSLAEMICAADTSCYTALDFYQRHCHKLWMGEKCTSRCNNSIQILYRQPKAKKLRQCYCDGTEEYDCPQLQYNTNFLCFGRKRHHHTHNRHNYHKDNNESRENDAQITVEMGHNIHTEDQTEAAAARSFSANIALLLLVMIFSTHFNVRH